MYVADAQLYGRSTALAPSVFTLSYKYLMFQEQMLDADIEIGYSTYHPTDEVWVYNCLTEVWFVLLF